MDAGHGRAGRRRFTIADGMILVAALSAGMAWSGRAWPTIARPFAPGTPASVAERAWEYVARGLAASTPSLVALTFALPLLRARRPGPSWRKASRQPGTTACLAASLGLLLFLPFVVGVVAYQAGIQASWPDLWRSLPAASLEMLAMAVPPVGFAVLIAWGVLAMQRRWRCEPGWIDRAGRAVGVLWIAAAGLLGTFWFRQFLR